MARGSRPLIFPKWPSVAAAALVLFLVLGTLLAVLWRAEGSLSLAAADLAAIRFTISQAIVSAVLSVGLAIPVARALARRQFRGRALFVTLLGAPFILPVIVAIIGLLAVFGRGGLVNAVTDALGLPSLQIYGFQGVVLAHVFFNLPLATRFLLQGWLSIPSERFRLAESLNAPVFRVLEWPMLRAVVPGALLAVFLICLTSFAVALTLGGGPRATTVELAIYQAIRFDFDLGKAAVLSIVQLTLCAAAVLAATTLAIPEGFGAGLDRSTPRWDGQTRAARIRDGLVITLAALFLLVPLAMIVLRGLPGLTSLPPSVWEAAIRSIAVALCATALTLLLAFALATRQGRALTLIGNLPLATSSLVVGTGLFVIVYGFVSPTRIALGVTVLLNAVMSLPFVLRILLPEIERVETDFGRLADSLRLTGWHRLRWLYLPRLRRPVGFAAGLSAALSMGDLGVIALFATDRQETLPLAMYRLMGAYRMEAAASAALVLVALSLLLFWVFDRGGRVDADA